MHGAHQAPSMTNWSQFVQAAPHLRQQRFRELEQILRQQMAGSTRRCLPDPRHGPFSAKAGSPLHQSSASARSRVNNTNPNLNNTAITSGANTRKVTFNLPSNRPPGGSALVRSRSSLYRSASDGTLDMDLQPDYCKLRTQRHLPEQPLDKAPLSPTLPMAKLRLQRQWTAERLTSGANSMDNFNLLPNTNPYQTHSVPSSPIKRPLTSHHLGRALPGTSGGSRLMNTTVEQQMARLRQRLPVCKSSPASAVISNSSNARSQTPVGRQIAKYGDSPSTQMRRELRYFAQERKRELEALGDERATYLGPYPPAWHEQLSSSDSDLNALLDLWSHPPDPVRDRQPPAGASNLQRVPQYVLGASGTSLHELLPTPTRRASYGCGGFSTQSARHWNIPNTGLYNSKMNNAYNSLTNLGYSNAYDLEYGCAGPSSRSAVRYGSCGRLDDYDFNQYNVYNVDGLDARDLNNNLIQSTSGQYAPNTRSWTNNPKSCVTLLPTRPYRL